MQEDNTALRALVVLACEFGLRQVSFADSLSCLANFSSVGNPHVDNKSDVGWLRVPWEVLQE